MDVSRRRAKLVLLLLSAAVLSLAPASPANGQSTGTIAGTAVDSFDRLEPETADNVDLGIRYSGERAAVMATYYDIDFRNRIFFLSPQTPGGPDYLVAGGGAYFNAGGIESRGVELSTTWRLTERMSFYTAYTLNRARATSHPG